MNTDNIERFYIPGKLNRTSTIAFYSIGDAVVLFLIAIPTVMLLIGFGNAIVLLPFLCYAVLRVRFGERTIGEKLKKILLHFSKPQIYLLKECACQSENHGTNEI